MASRRSNKRKRRNRGRFGFLYKFLSLVIILVVVGAGCVVFFRVEEVTVAGESKYTAGEIVAASGIERGDNLFLLNRSQTARNIISHLPYVDEVSIRHVLPDGVAITVTERTPVAVIQGAEGGRWIMDAKGQLLEQASSHGQSGLAQITGLAALLPTVGTKVAVEDAQSLRLESLMGLLQALTEQGVMEKVSAIDLSTANILMTYDGRFEVKMPMNTDFAYKVRALEATLASGQIQSNESGTIDLTRDGYVNVIP